MGYELIDERLYAKGFRKVGKGVFLYTQNNLKLEVTFANSDITLQVKSKHSVENNCTVVSRHFDIIIGYIEKAIAEIGTIDYSLEKGDNHIIKTLYRIDSIKDNYVFMMDVRSSATPKVHIAAKESERIPQNIIGYYTWFGNDAIKVTLGGVEEIYVDIEEFMIALISYLPRVIKKFPNKRVLGYVRDTDAIHFTCGQEDVERYAIPGFNGKVGRRVLTDVEIDKEMNFKYTVSDIVKKIEELEEILHNYKKMLKWE